MVSTLGIVLDGRFDLRRQVGMGAMGIVYDGFDRETARRVAVKILRGGSQSGAQRFMREGTILAELDHAAIVRYVTHGTSPKGETYLVMEWLEGQTLEERLEAGRLTIAESVQLARRVVEGLAVAHRRGVVHRDLKPSNLFLPDRVLKDAKLLDFGIAGRVWDQHRFNQTGAVVGTPLYMSPEQARGEDDIDERGDIYCLGAVLFECLTGEPPFMGASAMAILCKICLEEPPRLSKLLPEAPMQLDVLVNSMLAKDPALRPRDTVVLASALASIAGSSPPLQKRAPPRVTLTQGEQRVLCAIFVRGAATDPNQSFSDLTATVPPMADLPSQDALKDTLAPYGASLEHLVDGSMVITFPASVTPTDQAADAARCALSLRGIIPDALMAVCTGKGAMYGHLPIGDVIDRGVELLLDARPASTRLDATTAGLLDARFEIETSGNELYLESEREALEGSRTVLGKTVACLGRDRELSLLEGMFARAQAESVAQAVLVTATAGTGKSRVRQELIARLQRGGKFELLVGRADSLRTGSPFGLIAPSIRWAAGVTGQDSAETRRQKLRARVSRHVSNDKAARVTEFLGELAGITFADKESAALRAARQDARLMGDQMRAAWLDWLQAECAAKPVLLVLEDLHWSDAPSVQLIDATLRALRERPLMVLALARPEVTSRFPLLWQERGLSTIALEPLSRSACEELVVNVFGNDATPELVKRVVEQADGNPFFLEELLRGVAVGQTELPETVLAMVQSRLDAVGGDAGQVLRAASVFGQAFSLQAVRSLLGQAAALTAEGSLQTLVEREVILPRGSGGAHEFVFRHSLVRDASYATLTEGDRVLGHRLAGEWLEGAGETEAIVLAGHFDRGADRPRAATWYARAGAQALQGDDLDAAIAHAERSWACGASGETLSEASLVESQARYWRGELAAAVASARRAIENAGEATAPWFHAARELVSPIVDQGGIDEAREWANRVYATVAASQSAAEAQVACLSWYGGALAQSGLHSLAATLLERAEAILVTLPRRDPWVALRFHYAKGIHLASSAGQMDAIAELELALDAAELAGDARTACAIRGDLAFNWMDMGDTARAEELLRRVLADARQRSLAVVEAFTLPDLGLVLVCLGRLDEAKSVLTQSLGLAERQGSTWGSGLTNFSLSTLAYVSDDLLESERCARSAADSLRTSPAWHAAALSALARALLAQGRNAEALATANDAAALLEDLGTTRFFESLVRLMRAETRSATGDETGARDAIIVARDRLLERANRITDPRVRATFLSGVAENARTLQLAREWGCAALEVSRTHLTT